MQTIQLRTTRALPPVAFDDATIKTMLDGLQRRCEANSRAYRAGTMTAPDSHKLSDSAKRLIVVPSSESPSGEPITFFHSQELPASTLHEFGTFACSRRLHCDPSTTGIAVTLFQRFSVVSGFPVTALMMLRLFVASVAVSAKVHQDKFPTNKLLAQHVGMTTPELNRLEQTLVRALDWRVLVTMDQMQMSVGPLVMSSDELKRFVGGTLATCSDAADASATSNNSSVLSATGDSKMTDDKAQRDAMLSGDASSFFIAAGDSDLAVSGLTPKQHGAPAPALLACTPVDLLATIVADSTVSTSDGEEGDSPVKAPRREVIEV